MGPALNILGIESSCDETSAAVVRNGLTVLSNVTATSLKEHEKYGGIIPEIASRRQLEVIYGIVQAALNKARVKLSSIFAVAFTDRPGLIGSLLVGASFARALGFAIRKPLIQVDHLHAHLYANFLSTKKTPCVKHNARGFPRLPAIGLVVSGGHTSLFHVTDFHHFQLLGRTLDDAAGEAFDKVSRILGFGYPGGPAIDRVAGSVKETSLRFPAADLAGSFDFSFSGLKTAILYYRQKHNDLGPKQTAEIAFSFQNSIVTVLIKKAIAACQKKNVKTLLIGGGVAANSLLRRRLAIESKKNDIRLFIPEPELCLDNAAMIAGYGYHLVFKRPPRTPGTGKNS